MKRTALATFAIGLLLTTTALADQHHGNGRPGGEQHAAPHGGGVPHGGSSMRQLGGPQRSYSAPQMSFERHRTFNGGANNGFMREERGRPTFTNEERRGSFSRSTDNGFVRDRRRGSVFSTEERNRRSSSAFGGYSAGASERHGFGQRPGNWNDRPRNFSRGTYQRNFASPRRFHYGGYRGPSGWHYRRWSFGEFLPRIFWLREYWLTDWWLFYLPIPPYGYEWVRYGDDALLVNIYTGEILEVEYDVFY